MQSRDRLKAISVRHHCADFDSYRAARVKSLFNAETGCNFNLDVDLDLSGDWNIGVVVGPSGSGKTSIGKKIFGAGSQIHDYREGWPKNKPIIDAIVPGGSFDEVTGALAGVGLGDVPAWLRPFRVLSNGEQFRAGLARLIYEKPDEELAKPRLGTLIFHPSLLPRHRGRDAIRWAYHLDEKYTGVTWFWADSGLDTGDVCEQEVVAIGAKRPRDFYEQVIPVCVRLLRYAILDMKSGVVRRRPQNESAATYEPPFPRK